MSEQAHLEALIKENTDLKKVVDKMQAVVRAAEFLSPMLYLMNQSNTVLVAGAEATQPEFQEGVIDLLESLSALKAQS